MRFDGFGKVSLARITEMEREYDISLPTEYRDFLLNNNGGLAPKENRATVVLQQVSEEIDIEIMFGLGLEDCFDIDYWMRQYRDELPPRSLLIGNDTIKGFIILNQTEEGHRVYYWDDEHNFKASTDESNAYLIADDFSEFLKMINGLEGSGMKNADSKADRISNTLPLGSIVLLKGGIQKLLIIARALNVKNGDKEFFFDYGAVAYPEGLVGDQMAYFNQENISKVVFEGYRDDEDQVFSQRIQDYIESHPDIQKGTASNWNAE
jgi:hypothetical protein